jgi:hypothetical protein
MAPGGRAPCYAGAPEALHRSLRHPAAQHPLDVAGGPMASQYEPHHLRWNSAQIEPTQIATIAIQNKMMGAVAMCRLPTWTGTFRSDHSFAEKVQPR